MIALRRCLRWYSPKWYVFSIVAALVATIALAEDEEPLPVYYLRVVSFWAPYDVVFLPNGLHGLYFDTSECNGCRDSLEEWRFRGSLLIKGLLSDRHHVPLERESQLDGVVLASPDLTDLIVDNKATAILRVIPQAVPYDTLVWSKSRKQFNVVLDGAQFFILRFPANVDLDSVIASLRNIPGISSCQRVPIPYPDWNYQSPDTPWTPTDPLWNTGGWDSCWYLGDWPTKRGINAECAWGVFGDSKKGSTTVAILDWGTEVTHGDLAANYFGLTEGDTSIDTTDYGTPMTHGTKVAGVAVAAANNGVGGLGVAPDGIFIPYNVDDPANWQDSLTYGFASCIRRAVDAGARVLNMSWHLWDDWDPLWYELYRSKAAGNANVCAAGNAYSPPTCFPYRGYPALYNDVTIAVGAYDQYGQWRTSSNHGCPSCPCSVPHFVDVIAPGLGMGTTTVGNQYTLFSGTSAATAVVSGLAALAIGYNEDLDHDRILDALKTSANASGLSTPGCDSLCWGAGRVDACEFIKLVQTSAPERQTSQDSVPCLIITHPSYVDDWEPLATKKTKQGTRTEVLETTYIGNYYSAGDLQADIRACIKDYYDNHHLEYVILGGNESSVPFRFVFNDLYGPGQTFVSDYYYACLDGDWNADADGVYGEPEDEVDLVPEVAVGRIPTFGAADIATYLDKLEDYESATSNGWRTRVLGHGSKMFREGDGRRHTSHMLSYFTDSMSITELYDDTAIGTATKENFIESFNEGNGIVLLYGLAQNAGDYILWRGHADDVLYTGDVDTLSNNHMPSVVYSNTCWNHDYDESCMAEHYMNHDSGGAVAYIGSSCNDFILCSREATEYFFEHLFGGGPYEIGKLLNQAKSVLISESDYEGGYRHTMFSYLLSGDPQMRIWTTEAQELAIEAPYWLSWDLGPQDFDITVTSSGSPVESVLVCVSHDDDLYELAYTNSSGIAHFEDVEPPEPDSVDTFITICASKHNYFTELDDTTMRFTDCNVPGDADANCFCNVSDAVFIIAYIFGGGPEPAVWNRFDADGNCIPNISDAIYLIAYINGGGPAPDTGCITYPPGGKIASANRDPLDREQVPGDLEPSSLIQLSVRRGQDSEGKRITLESDRDIHGLSLTLRTYSDSPVSIENLVPSNQATDIKWHRYGNIVKIGIVDITGQKYLRSGVTDILAVEGDFELDYALAACLTENWEVETLMPQVSNLDTLIGDYSFDPNYPNPFNPNTTLSFSLPRHAHVSLEIYNVLGQKVKTLVDEFYPPGRHTVEWDGRDDSGTAVASGIYFSRFSAGEFKARRKMVIVK